MFPYRFNPPGAHIDHQEGAVLARCLDQYTTLVFWPSDSNSTIVHACLHLVRYPALQGLARVVIAESESTVRIVSPEPNDPIKSHHE